MNDQSAKEALAALPSVDRLLGHTEVVELIGSFGRPMVVDSIRHSIGDVRAEIRQQRNGFAPSSLSDVVIDRARQRCTQLLTPSLRPVINLTGTVLHTNLGRAPLPQACIERIVAVAGGASNLEFDLEKGKRGDRDSHVERWIQRHTGAEAATVVNNNAAAVLLTLNSLARQQGVAVSRGELVEIGGSFRIPDVMSRAGCNLIEVGTTNRTHASDYISGIDSGAVVLMKVHTSNYEIKGFTKAVDEAQLSEIAASRDVLSITDLGSGCLMDLSQWGLPRERTVAEVIETGIDVVTFSGDKLLGGPQCGVIAGKRAIIDQIRANPMKRALRCDKLTLAALEAVLEMYANPETVCQSIPALRLLTRSREEISALANDAVIAVREALQHNYVVETVDCDSQIGSGAVPVDTLASVAIKISPKADSGASISQLAQSFRELPKPVMGRVHDAALWFDLRCLERSSDLTDSLENIK